jgi:anti-sigma factor RsiW
MMNRDCKRFAKRLDAYADGAVTTQLHAAMEAHVASCPACRRELESLAQIGGVLRAAPPPPPVPEGFALRVMARAAACGESAPKRTGSALPAFAWWRELARPARAAAAAVLVVGLALGAMMGWDMNRNGRIPQPTSGKSDALAAFNLDYLGDAPAGSLAQVVMALNK